MDCVRSETNIRCAQYGQMRDISFELFFLLVAFNAHFYHYKMMCYWFHNIELIHFD